MSIVDKICGKITDGQSFDCKLKSSGGIRQKVILINRDDIDYGLTIPTEGIDDGTGEIKHTLENLVLLSGKTGYLYETSPSKRNQAATFELSKQDFADYWIHGVNVMVNNLCPAALSFLDDLSDGAEIIAIVENNDKGTNNECAFMVYGFKNGLKAATAVYNSNENNGYVPIELRSEEPNLEPTTPYQLLITDYATTRAAFDNLFANP